MTEWFDSHCHVDEEKFNEDRDTVLTRMREHGITRYAVIGSDLETSRHAILFAREQEGAVAAGGFHPHEARKFREADCEEITRWWKNGEIRAIGEIGLDYYYDLSPRDVQKRVMAEQVALAVSLDVPVIFHIRDAHGDMVDFFRSCTRLPAGIIHCFSGSPEIAREYVKMGFYISFAGPLTFKKAPHLQAAAQEVPLDRLLVETDSPYLSPEPKRGRRNEPAHVVYTLTKLAELHGLPVD